MAPSAAVRWSVVIPAYNEAARLPRYLREVVSHFDGRDQPYEVLVMDDGSTDDTAARVREERAAHPAVRLLSLGTNQGKGAAVRAGMLQATGSLRLMTDADGATPIGELKRLEAAIHGGADLAVASRALHDPSVVVRARLLRRLSGRVFIAAARALGVRQVVDTQCGFKLFRGAVADELFGALRTNGFGFDVELVLRAERRGYRIAEIPVNWTDQPGSKVGVFSDGPRMLAQIVAARMRLSGEAGEGGAMIARRAREIEPFLAVEVFQRAQALERAGADVIHLEYGEPDFETPSVIREAAEKALKDGHTRYVHTLGILPLREAIAEHYRTRYGVDVSPDRILVTAGTSPAMLLLFGALLERGDQVILSDPHYACYPKFVKYAEAEPVSVNVHEADGFQLHAEAVAAALTPRTQAILVNSPANPTGSVLAPERMAALARLGPWVVSDEIYHGLTYEGPEHTILEFTDKAFVLNGFSKAYAMTGWRCGYVIAPAEFMPTLTALHGNFFISSNEFVQWAALAALREAGSEAAGFRRVFDERRQAMVAGLRRIGLGVTTAPTGAFYVLANARRYTQDSLAFAFEILDRTHVAVTPGVDFGRNAEGYLRFAYANSLPRIEEALTRLGRFLSERGA